VADRRSLSAFILAIGLIAWMHKMFAAAPLVFAAGMLGVLYTMIGWWLDVIKEAEFKGDHTRVVQISHRYGMICFIASEVISSWPGSGLLLQRAGFRPTCITSRAPSCRRRVAAKGIETFDPGTCRCSTR